MSIIGITGKAGAGKDTVANMLVDMIADSERHGFADAVKEMIYAIDPIVGTFADYDGEGDQFFHLSDAVGLIGWDEAKLYPEVRRLLQRTGTEGGRAIFGENVWVDLLFSRWVENVPFLIVPDVRFANEKQICDVVIEVTRPGAFNLGANAGHASEAGITGDICIVNDGTMEELENKVGRVVMHLHSQGLLD